MHSETKGEIRCECNSIVESFKMSVGAVHSIGVKSRLKLREAHSPITQIKYTLFAEALRLLGLTSLRERRQHLCRQYVCKLQDVNSPLHFLLPRREDIVHNYDLRSGTSRSNIKPRRTKRSQAFVTFRYYTSN